MTPSKTGCAGVNMLQVGGTMFSAKGYVEKVVPPTHGAQTRSIHHKLYLIGAGEPLQDDGEQGGGVLLWLQPPPAEVSRELKPE